LIHVVLDTNIYRQNPDRDNAHFQALGKLSQADIVKLHIPYIVEREFQTQQREIYSKDIDKAISGLSGLSRKKLSPKFAQKIVEIKAQVESEREKVLSDAEMQIVQWAEELKANRIPLCLDQAQNAMEAYFQGNRPLKEIKKREDIPDSFVVQSIDKILKENGNIHVVAGDKKIQESFSGSQTSKVYLSLSDFIESELIQNELKDLDVIENLEKIKEAIAIFEKETGEVACRVSIDIGEKIVWETIHDPSIPDDNHDATISSYNDIDKIELDFAKIFYFGNGKFGIPFSVKLTVGAIYYIFKADYYCMDPEIEHVPSVSDHNDHYYEAEDEFEVEVTGMATLCIDRDNIDFEEFAECIKYDSIKIDLVDGIGLCE
jgi:hypothetical protein